MSRWYVMIKCGDRKSETKVMADTFDEAVDQVTPMVKRLERSMGMKCNNPTIALESTPIGDKVKIKKKKRR